MPVLLLTFIKEADSQAIQKKGWVYLHKGLEVTFMLAKRDLVLLPHKTQRGDALQTTIH